ncbi:MAG: ABC transporter ATP-binding protein [Sphingomonadaceae bacterium]
MALIELHRVGKCYTGAGLPVMALRDVDLQIDEGEMVAIMGPSGSGKSTLLTVLGAMTPPTSGTVLMDGIDVYALPAERRADFRHEYLGFVFQQQHLVPYLTALENVMLPMAISRRPHRDQEEMALAALERVGLADKLHRLPSQLSGGEQERVAIARAVVNEPPIVLADEPTGCLDSETGAEVMELLRTLNREGLTVLVVTHNPDNTRYAQRTVRLKDGLIVGDERHQPEQGSLAGAAGVSN